MPRRAPLARAGEDGFTTAVLGLAKLLGWRTAHFRPGLTRRGRWVTAVQGDGVGFPDVLAVRRGVLVVAELKVGRNTPTAEQEDWLAAFRAAGVNAYVWTPAHWPEIEAVLKGEA